ncbi:MAG: uridine kinase [Firmicutes bacterium]|uniref:uridine/cytidine kinase n=1 Tax=Candidatus Onthovivens merdipullorum TaxID=2840889 RepID=A0A9D9DIA4_9BACL|nr:uridine kinase [Candidatus Onthovivens merdipullorum]
MAHIVLVGGGSASGKTYILNKVIDKLGKENVTHISIDDYYKKLDMPLEERRKVNFDHPKAFDWDLIETQLKMLKENKTIEKPVYDYTISNRSDKVEIITPKNLVLVEGIMALVNKKIRALSELNIFIDASRENRLVRRIKRDQVERARTFDSIVTQYFTSVLPMYEEIIDPTKYYADIIINNDGQKNHSIEVLISILSKYLD